MRPSLNLGCMGSMGGLVKLIPGMNKVTPQQIHDAEKSLIITDSMINSMTPKECADLELIAKSPSRRRSVALGSGRTQEQVNVLNCSVTDLSDAYVDEESGKCDARGSSIPGLELGLEDPHSGQSKAKPGTAERKKSSWGFQSWFISSGAEEVFQKDLVPKNEQREVMSF
ncbi:unnamed protein product [Sphagnum balticum]